MAGIVGWILRRWAGPVNAVHALYEDDSDGEEESNAPAAAGQDDAVRQFLERHMRYHYVSHPRKGVGRRPYGIDPRKGRVEVEFLEGGKRSVAVSQISTITRREYEAKRDSLGEAPSDQGGATPPGGDDQRRKPLAGGSPARPSPEPGQAGEQGRGTTDLALFVGVAFAWEGLLWLLGGWITAALGLPMLTLIVMAYRLDVLPRRERLRLEAAKSVSDTKLVPDADNDEAFVNEAERWAGEATNPHLTRAQAREALIRAMEFVDVFLAEDEDIEHRMRSVESTKDQI